VVVGTGRFEAKRTEFAHKVRQPQSARPRKHIYVKYDVHAAFTHFPKNRVRPRMAICPGRDRKNRVSLLFSAKTTCQLGWAVFDEPMVQPSVRICSDCGIVMRVDNEKKSS
jgi:hypothetical protein